MCVGLAGPLTVIGMLICSDVTVNTQEFGSQ